ncbi:hypothetical protein QQP08_026415 [Theobroma cacao]|nr:hypothetical protein QQP08_025006 [Theobroma cacao]WRX33928.1 hypothetical protein QQP08_026415 [Theobroma cacao]
MHGNLVKVSVRAAQLLLSILHRHASIRSILESIRLKLLIPLVFSAGFQPELESHQNDLHQLLACGQRESEGLWSPFSSKGSRRDARVGSTTESSLSRNVLNISVLRKFITWTAYISAVKGSAICNQNKPRETAIEPTINPICNLHCHQSFLKYLNR